jgi:tetratricopeptide (TPR) repeat protein
VLKDFVAQNPGDPFPRYGLAMEHKSRGDLEAARAEFIELIERAPGYVATYLMYGNLLDELGATDEAAAIYRDGVEVARSAGDGHAASELTAALAELGNRS